MPRFDECNGIFKGNKHAKHLVRCNAEPTTLESLHSGLERKNKER